VDAVALKPAPPELDGTAPPLLAGGARRDAGPRADPGCGARPLRADRRDDIGKCVSGPLLPGVPLLQTSSARVPAQPSSPLAGIMTQLLLRCALSAVHIVAASRTVLAQLCLCDGF